MGGSTEIGASLRRWKQTRACYWNNLVPKHARKLKGPVVHIEDVPIRMNDMRGQTFTGTHLYNALMRPVRDKFKLGRIARYVFCFDKNVIVPLRKGVEQERRDGGIGRRRSSSSLVTSGDSDEDGKIVKYSDAAWIVDGGIWDPALGVDPETGAVPKICINSILKARTVRYIVMLYLHQRLMMDKDMYEHDIILDYAEIPYFVRGGMSYPMKQWHSPFGEAEIMCVKWARAHMEHYDVIIDTTDTDITAISFGFIESCKPPNEVLWRIGKERKTTNAIYEGPCDEHCDLKALYSSLATKFNVTAKTYALAFILCGVDYHTAKDILVGCTPEWVFQRIIQGPKHLVDAVAPSYEWLSKETDVCWQRPTGFIDYDKKTTSCTTERYTSALYKLADAICDGSGSRGGGRVVDDPRQGANNCNWTWTYWSNIAWLREPGCVTCPELCLLLGTGTTEPPTRPNWDAYKASYQHSKFKLTTVKQMIAAARPKKVINLLDDDDDDDDDVVVVTRESKAPIVIAPPQPPPPAVAKRKRRDYEAERVAALNSEEPETKRLRNLLGLFASAVLKF